MGKSEVTEKAFSTVKKSGNGRSFQSSLIEAEFQDESVGRREGFICLLMPENLSAMFQDA